MHFKTNCNCGQLWCWFHPPPRDTELSRHRADAEGCTGRRTDRAIPLGSTPLERYLQTTHPSSGSRYWESYLVTYAFLKNCNKDIISDITAALNRCGGWKGHMGGYASLSSPSFKNTHSSQPCGGIQKPFGGLPNLVPQRAVWITHLKEHKRRVVLA